MLWAILIIFDKKLSEKEIDFITDLIDTESHNAIKKYSFIFHNILVDKNSFEAIIEGQRCAVKNIVEVLLSNTPYKVIYKRIF